MTEKNDYASALRRLKSKNKKTNNRAKKVIHDIKKSAKHDK
ncbi:putative metal homeostasis protein [Lentilactobacillus laojiaonis]|nr:putative metal homeostasis protein [Lentilactobacillus laojiaonis]UDM32670.1 putative metal homeostasis protein [Lentilactobacillus laojiaonis]